MRMVRAVHLLCGALLLVVPALAGPPGGRLLLVTGALTLALGGIWQRPGAMTLTAAQGVVVAGLAITTLGAAGAATLGAGCAAALTGYLLTAEALDEAWPGLPGWLRRRGPALLCVLASALALACLELLPAVASVPLFVVGAIALVAAFVVATARPRADRS